MITLTRFPNGEQIALNVDLIERAEANPDTVITLADGTRYIVKETVDEVLEIVKRYRAEVMALAHQLSCLSTDVSPGHLRLVGPSDHSPRPVVPGL